MDNIIIPIGKCYKVSNSPINKNLINIVSFTENEPSMVSDELTSETEFNYWVISDSDAETTQNEIYNNCNLLNIKSDYFSSSLFFALISSLNLFIASLIPPTSSIKPQSTACFPISSVPTSFNKSLV